MSPSVLIRPAADADGIALSALIAEIFAEYENCQFVADEFPELVAPASYYRAHGGVLLVAEENGALVGSFAISDRGGSVFEINKVYVAAAARGSGLALALYDRARDEALSRGASAFKLWTDTRFLRGHGYYEKLGFVRQPVVRYLADSTEAWEFAYRLELHPGRV